MTWPWEQPPIDPNVLCAACSTVFDSGDIRNGGICGNCGQLVCAGCWQQHKGAHFTLSLTRAGDVISHHSSANRKTKKTKSPLPSQGRLHFGR